MLKSSLVCALFSNACAVRTAKFVSRKQWVICGADDLFIRVYNYNTMDKVKQWEAHTDYVRCVAPHPTLPLLLSCSDDMLIKLWDWDRGWQCTQIFEGHSHYVMQVAFNPKDTNTFASASLDRTVKVWSLGSPVPNFTLEGHERGVNAIDYYTGGDRPYLASGADDSAVKIWDYQTKACIQTLEGHSHNISAVAFHPELPLILTGSEDGTVKLWHATTYRLENTLNYGMERVWAIASTRGSNSVAIGYDEGCVMIKLGREDPVASMDVGGKVIWARHNEIQTVNIRALGDAALEEADGERLPLAVKDLGSSEIYPQSLAHSPNGRFVAVCGDGEYVVYTALAWRNKAFGTALEFVWGEDSNVFATREGPSTLKIYKNFKEALTVRLPFAAEAIYGGRLLGARTSDFIVFYDWNTGSIVRRVDVAARGVYWSESGATLIVAAESSFYVLSFAGGEVDAFLAEGGEPDDDGIEDALTLESEIPETVRTGIWVGDCFIYNNSAWRLNYCVGGEVSTVHHLDRPMYLLGYLAQQSRAYLIDRDFNVVSYTLLLSVVEYKTLVMRGDMESAEAVLETIPMSYRNELAKFLDARGLPEEALKIATDDDLRFELAVGLGKLELAQQVAEAAASDVKWRQLGEMAINSGRLTLAESCFDRAGDLGGLLLLRSSRGDVQGMSELAEQASDKGRHNIAFVCKLMTGDVDGCIDMLEKSGRLPEAAFFARTYRPSRVTEMVKKWQTDLAKVNPKAAEALANPDEFPNLFPGFQEALEEEGKTQTTRDFANLSVTDTRAHGPEANGNVGGYSVAKATDEEGSSAMPDRASGEANQDATEALQQPTEWGEEAFENEESAFDQRSYVHHEEQPLRVEETQLGVQAPVEEADTGELEDFFDSQIPEEVSKPTAPVDDTGATTETRDPKALTSSQDTSGLTPEEEALLELGEEDLAELEALAADDLDDIDVDLDDDWGVDDEGEKLD